jgi:yeast amino acid transporter
MSEKLEKGQGSPPSEPVKGVTGTQFTPDVYHEAEPSMLTRMGLSAESFKRRTLVDESNQLNQTLKMRHLHMIAIGGSIGAGLFVGSGKALSTGGPASLIIDFMIIGIMMFNVVYALGELSIMYPVSGGFYTYSTRFIDPSWGFAMGWNYVFQWAIVLPLELTVAGLTVQYWEGARNVSVGVWITIFFLSILIINVFGVLGYAEEEFWSSFLKLTAVVIFLIVSLVMVLGGAPANEGRCGPGFEPTGCYREYWGARYWYNPGAFNNGFKGFCSVFVTAAFAFSGTELVGLAAAESENPTKHLPGAVKQVFWRITLFYVLSLFFIGLLVPYDDPRLLGSGLIDVTASPFVIVAANAGLKGFDSFLNVVIMISVVSIGMSGVYGGSRTLTALAEQGYAPKIFAYIDRAGRPLPSTALIIAFGLLAYLNLAAAGPIIFDWLLALSGLAALFTWGSICLCHIRFRNAWKYHGHTLDELPFKAIGGVYGSYMGLSIIVLVLIAQFYIACDPIGGGSSAARVESFFKSYLALPVVLMFWAAGYFWKRTGWLKVSQIDIDTGRREHDWEKINKEREILATKGPIRRAIAVMF